MQLNIKKLEKWRVLWYNTNKEKDREYYIVYIEKRR